MSIKEDAGVLLLYIYAKKVKGERIPQFGDLAETTKWEQYRLENALGYCIDGNFLVGLCKIMGDGTKKWSVVKMTNPGIDIIENTKEDDNGKREFNVAFNLTINNEFNIDSIMKGEAKLFG